MLLNVIRLCVNCVGVLVVGLGYAFPFAVEFEQQQEIGEVDATAPFFFENTHNGDSFLNCEYIYPGFEVGTGAYGVDIVIELFDRSMFEHSVEYTEQDSIVGKQLFGVFS